MSANTKISWCDSTWNPWRGCSKVSLGCKNCYAEKLVNGRLAGDFSMRVRAKPETFNAPLRWNKKPWVCVECNHCSAGEFDECECGAVGALCCRRHRRRVFLGSLMDWLGQEVPIEWLADTLDIVRDCYELTFLCLTKRPELFKVRLEACCEYAAQKRRLSTTSKWLENWFEHGIVPEHVWVGVSVEDQKRADERIPVLLTLPAKVRFVSAEPLLEVVDFTRAGQERQNALTATFQGRIGDSRIDWVIVGGESGPKRRDCGVKAIVDVARQCQSSRVPVFVKQDCHARPGQQGRIPDDVWALKEFPI